jgi:ABC-2 type transport system permease protein
MFKIALKDIRLFLTDRRALIMTFLMPIALISIFAMAFGGERERKSKQVTILVTDQDQTEISKSVVNELDSSPNLKVVRLRMDSAERLVKTGEKNAVLILESGFSDSISKNRQPVIKMKYDELSGASVAIMQQALMGSLMEIIGKKQAAHAPVVPDSVKSALFIAKNYLAVPKMNMKMIPVVEEKQGSPGLIQAVAGTAVMMLLFGVAAMGAGMLEEKENGTLKRLLYSPINPQYVLLGKVIASTFVSLFQLMVLFGFAAIAFDLDLGKNTPALLLMWFTTAFACAGFGVFLSSIAKSRQQVQMLSTLVVMSMSAIGGSMVPSFLMPEFMQKLSVLSVNYWSIQGFYDIYWRNLAFTDTAFLLRPLMLFLIGSGMMGLGMFFFKRNVMKLS